MSKNLSTYHFQRISHSIGVNLYNAIMSDDKKYKTLPKEFYRNHYQKESDYYLDELVLFEMATKREVFGQNVYNISEEGIHAFRAWFEKNIIHVPKTKHDIEYVRYKIDLYCWYQNYTFRSDHVVSEFKEKYHKGEYMSHTTRDVVNMFENQLKKYCK